MSPHPDEDRRSDAIWTSNPQIPGQTASADLFVATFDVVCKKFGPGIAPMSTEQQRAAALLADETSPQYRGRFASVAATLLGRTREALPGISPAVATRPRLNVRTAQMAFRALFDLNKVRLPKR